MHAKRCIVLARARAVVAACLLAAALPLLIQSCSVDRGLGPTTQGIRGTVVFEGSWPDSIRGTRVAVLKAFPASGITDLAGYSGEIVPGTTLKDYSIELPEGEYPLVGVVCRTGDVWGPDAVKCVLGFYEDRVTPWEPAAVCVTSGAFTDSVDITVRFGE